LDRAEIVKYGMAWRGWQLERRPYQPASAESGRLRRIEFLFDVGQEQDVFGLLTDRFGNAPVGFGIAFRASFRIEVTGEQWAQIARLAVTEKQLL
jgi:hypothetical protein